MAESTEMLLLGGEAAAAVFDLRQAREDADNREVVVVDGDWRSFGRTAVDDDVADDDFPPNVLSKESTTTTAFEEPPPPPPLPPDAAAGHSDSDLSGTLEQLALLAPLIKECERESKRAAPADVAVVDDAAFFAEAASAASMPPEEKTPPPPAAESNVAAPAFEHFLCLSVFPPPSSSL